MKIYLFWVERASTGVNYKSVYIFKYGQSYVEISFFDRDYTKPSSVRFYENDNNLVSVAQLRKLGEEIKSGEHIRKFIKCFFEGVK